jgi:pimeloyl-ACP methyl ester carboxylesterase
VNDKFFIKKLHKTKKTIRLIWLHGWGVDHRTLLPISSFFNNAENYLLDLPGFGNSSSPKKPYNSEDYAKEIINWLKSFKTHKPTYIIGHSFGGQIAIQIANKLQKKIDGIILIGGSGLKRKRSLIFKLKFFIFKTITTILKITLGKNNFKTLKEKFASRIGSDDYKRANNIMREILIKVTKENLKNIAKNIKIPTLLIYGSNDLQTPVYFGERYNKLIKKSDFIILPKLNHYTILSDGKHQVQNLINNFIKNK